MSRPTLVSALLGPPAPVTVGHALLDGEPVDVNQASVEDLMVISGIGPSTARAIVEAREGGVVFYEVDDLRRVRGIGAATVRAVGSLLTVGDVGPRPPPPKLNLNSATVRQLDRLPDIGPVLAQRIVDHREGRGPFTAVGDLERVRGIGEATMARVRPLVMVVLP